MADLFFIFSMTPLSSDGSMSDEPWSRETLLQNPANSAHMNIKNMLIGMQFLEKSLQVLDEKYDGPGKNTDHHWQVLENKMCFSKGFFGVLKTRFEIEPRYQQANCRDLLQRCDEAMKRGTDITNETAFEGALTDDESKIDLNEKCTIKFATEICKIIADLIKYKA